MRIFDYFELGQQDSGKPEPEAKPVSDDKVYKILKLLRQYGIPCFLPEDLIDSDIEKLIKGNG